MEMKKSDLFNKIVSDITNPKDSQEKMFVSFAHAVVEEMDSRDITTSGHSKRLAGYALAIAVAVNEDKYGMFSGEKYSMAQLKELYFASLLHDVGKISISEDILLKKGRVSNDRLEKIRYRFAYLKKELELKLVKNIINEDEKEVLEKIDNYYTFLADINSQEHINEKERSIVDTIASIEYTDIDGHLNTVLDEYEAESFSVNAGNLTDEERQEMKLHVTYTYDFLKEIEWIDEMKGIPEIIGGHHEKIDGSGYPYGITGEKITLSQRIIGMLDIFEGLTAGNVLYKKIFTMDEAIQILNSEADAGRLDKRVVEVFIKEKIYEYYKEEIEKIVRI